ncbi:MAG: hypothetical protein AB1410_01355 [Acidobacteriota bacterium]
MREKLIVILVILAVLGGYLSHSYLAKYLFIEDIGSSWIEKCWFLSFFMVIMGFITVLEWDVIFPDLRDYSVLSPLPIKLRTLFTSKFTSLLFFVGMFSLSTNFFSVFIFSVYLTHLKKVSFLYFFQYLISHSISVYAANLFIFFSLVFIEGLLMSVFSYSMFKKISTYIQTFFMAFFVSVFALLPKIHSSLSTLREKDSIFLYLFPPMWFTGLYENLLGRKNLFYSALSGISLLAIGIPVVVFFITVSISYRKHLKRTQEVKKGATNFLRLKIFFAGIFNKIFLRNSVQRAIFHFFGNTLIRSKTHRLHLGAYIAVALGFIFAELLPQIFQRGSEINIYVPNKTLLSIPHILSFIIIIGLRVTITIPLSLEANWIFKLTEIQNKRDYLSGMRKGGFFYIILPLYFLLFILYFFLWGWKYALLHCIYGLTISALFMEAILVNFRKIPFACSYLPGKANLKLLWPVYLLSFISYVYFFTHLEYWLLKNQSYFLIFYPMALSLYLGIKIYRRYFIDLRFNFKYEESPEPVMVSLDLNNA